MRSSSVVNLVLLGSVLLFISLDYSCSNGNWLNYIPSYHSHSSFGSWSFGSGSSGGGNSVSTVHGGFGSSAGSHSSVGS